MDRCHRGMTSSQWAQWKFTFYQNNQSGEKVIPKPREFSEFESKTTSPSKRSAFPSSPARSIPPPLMASDSLPDLEEDVEDGSVPAPSAVDPPLAPGGPPPPPQAKFAPPPVPMGLPPPPGPPSGLPGPPAVPGGAGPPRTPGRPARKSIAIGKVDMLSQIKAGGMLKKANTVPKEQPRNNLLDSIRGAKKVGLKSVALRKTPAKAKGAAPAAAGGGGLAKALASSLENYRKFVQGDAENDDEDSDDDWD